MSDTEILKISNICGAPMSGDIEDDFLISTSQKIERFADNYYLVISGVKTWAENIVEGTYGTRLRYITNEKLKGAIRKTYVGGREGHRLIYIYNPQKSLIIPIHLTSELRCDIDYRKTLWEQITDQIYNDYINKKHDKFVNWK